MAIDNLHKAKEAKYDEFFTRFEDIDKELINYMPYFKEKVIYCNTDDPDVSAFASYFLVSSPELQWRTVLFSWLKPNGAGSFDSPDSIKKLKECDVVITNPPFSKIKPFLRLLQRYNKDFLIIVNPNIVTYKEVFPLIRDNKIWLGCKKMGTDMLFNITDEYAKELVENRSKSSYRIINGKVYGRTAAVWLTNIDHKQRHQWLDLSKKYNPSDYSILDNYDAINVDRVDCIPKDYTGVMAVPITFLNYYNPEQFKIIGMAAHHRYDQSITGLPLKDGTIGKPLLNGKLKFARIFIQKNN